MMYHVPLCSGKWNACSHQEWDNIWSTHKRCMSVLHIIACDDLACITKSRLGGGDGESCDDRWKWVKLRGKRLLRNNNYGEVCETCVRTQAYHEDSYESRVPRWGCSTLARTYIRIKTEVSILVASRCGLMQIQAYYSVNDSFATCHQSRLFARLSWLNLGVRIDWIAKWNALWLVILNASQSPDPCNGTNAWQPERTT